MSVRLLLPSLVIAFSVVLTGPAVYADAAPRVAKVKKTNVKATKTKAAVQSKTTRKVKATGNRVALRGSSKVKKVETTVKPSRQIWKNVAGQLGIKRGQKVTPKLSKAKVRKTMTKALDGLASQYTTSAKTVNDLHAKEIGHLADSIVAVMGKGKTANGKTVTVFKNKAELMKHYETVLAPESIGIYDSRVVVAMEHINANEMGQIVASTKNNSQNIQAANSDRVNQSRYGYQYKQKGGNPRRRFASTFGFVRFKTKSGQRVNRAMFSMEQEPYMAALVHKPVVLKLLENALNAANHDTTMHNLFHQNGGVRKGEITPWQSKMTGKPWSKTLKVINNEIDSSVGHYMVMQHYLKNNPGAKAKFVKEMHQFDKAVNQMAKSYSGELYKAAIAKKAAKGPVSHKTRAAEKKKANEKAEDVRDYFIHQYVQQGTEMFMGPKQHKEVGFMYKKYPILETRRTYQKTMQERAMKGETAYPGASHAEILHDFRNALDRFQETK